MREREEPQNWSTSSNSVRPMDGLTLGLARPRTLAEGGKDRTLTPDGEQGCQAREGPRAFGEPSPHSLLATVQGKQSAQGTGG